MSLLVKSKNLFKKLSFLNCVTDSNYFDERATKTLTFTDGHLEKRHKKQRKLKGTEKEETEVLGRGRWRQGYRRRQ